MQEEEVKANLAQKKQAKAREKFEEEYGEFRARFLDVLGVHLNALMEERQWSLQDVAENLGLSNKNYVFRAGLGSDHQGVYNLVRVPENLLKMLDFLELEPRDFSREGLGRASRGHLADTILRLEGVTQKSRHQLLDVVNAFLRKADAD